tara:strand:+ start:59756 stop:60169 length:414 start_codon:yes stop_codon:yes gene_type:complete
MRALLMISIVYFNATDTCAREIAVIVNKDVSVKVSNDQIVQIFMGRLKKLDDGSKVVPIGRNEKSDIYLIFNRKVLNRSNKQIKAYWSRMIFTGRDVPPRAIETDADVLDLVAKNPNLIGYIEASQINDSVKVIREL